MFRNLAIFAAAIALQLAATGATLATCAAITHHLSLEACREEARLSHLSDAHCALR